MKHLMVFVFSIILLFANGYLYPSTGHNVEVNCPLCNNTVSYWMQLSYSIFTYGLDLKPIGAARIPEPIPRCNDCGFVFIEDYLTNEEIQILKTYVIDQNILSGKENLPNYYYLAYLLELLDNWNYNEITYFYVASVWEYSLIKMTVEYIEEHGLENTNGLSFDMEIYNHLMLNAINKINNMNNDSEEYNNMQMIKLDFLRRLGLFEEATLQINYIMNNENLFQGIFIDIIAYQIKLIEANDINEHNLMEVL